MAEWHIPRLLSFPCFSVLDDFCKLLQYFLEIWQSIKEVDCGKGHYREISDGFISYSISLKPIKLSFDTEWNRSKLPFMLTWDWCKMLNTNVPMICTSCVPYLWSAFLRTYIIYNQTIDPSPYA